MDKRVTVNDRIPSTQAQAVATRSAGSSVVKATPTIEAFVARYAIDLGLAQVDEFSAIEKHAIDGEQNERAMRPR